MNDSTKSLLDAGAGVITVSTIMEWIPAATAILSLVWVLIRIYETKTLQRVLNKKSDMNSGDDNNTTATTTINVNDDNPDVNRNEK